MNAKEFIAEFGYIVNAPDGVEKLRTLVIQFAIQGKLVENDTSERSPSDLIEEISKTKKLLILEKIMPREKVYPDVKSGELPLERPSNWLWPRFGEVWQLISGRDLPRSHFNEREIGIPYITGASNIENGIIDVNRWTDKPVVVSKKEDLLITCKGTIGKTAFNTIGDIHIARQIMAIRDFSNLLNPNYLKIWLETYVAQLIEKSRSMIPGFSRDDLLYAVFPLPPLKEQKRIVAKVDELMALCDKLETQQQKRRKLRTLTRTAALDALTNAQSAKELKTAWQRVQDNLPLFIGDLDSVDAIQNLLANLAVRGYLSPRRIKERIPIDEVILTTVKVRKEYLKKKWLRRQKAVGISHLEIDNFPKHWETIAFDEIAIVIGGITKGRNLTNRKTAFYPYLRVANVQRGYFDLSEIKEIEIPLDEVDKYQLMEGDLLITEGGDWDKVGRTAIWQGQIKTCLHQNHIFKARVPSELVLNDWVELVFNSEIGRNYFAGASKQTTNLASINMTQLRSFPFPIPPIKEQEDIIKTYRAMLETLRVLHKQFTRKQTLAERFSQAAVAAITGTQIKEKQTMKAPKTELVTKLKLKKSPKNKDQAPLSAILARHNGELSAKSLYNYSGIEIDSFYQQLKTEMAQGWIVEPEKARVVETFPSADGAEVA